MRHSWLVSLWIVLACNTPADDDDADTAASRSLGSGSGSGSAGSYGDQGTSPPTGGDAGLSDAVDAPPDTVDATTDAVDAAIDAGVPDPFIDAGMPDPFIDAGMPVLFIDAAVVDAAVVDAAVVDAAVVDAAVVDAAVVDAAVVDAAVVDAAVADASDAADAADAADAGDAADAAEELIDPVPELAAPSADGALDVAGFTGTTATWVDGVMIDPNHTLAQIDSQLALPGGGDIYDRARELYQQHGIFDPANNEAHASWLHVPVVSCTANCYLVVEPLHSPNDLPEQTAPNSACSHPNDSDTTRDSNVKQKPRPDYTWDMWTCVNRNQSSYRANISLRCDYSRACANSTIGCRFKYTQVIRGNVYAWAWRRYNVAGDPAKLTHFPYEAKATAKVEATLYGPLAANNWQKQELAFEAVAHSKTEPTDNDKLHEALDDVELEVEVAPVPKFKVSGAGAAFKVAAELYRRWRVAETAALTMKETLIESGFKDFPFTVSPNQPAATFKFELGQIRLKSDRDADVDSFNDALKDHNGRANAQAWAYISTWLAEPELNPVPPVGTDPPQRCVLGLGGQGAQFTTTTGMRRDFTQAEQDAANGLCSIWAIQNVRTNRATMCNRRTGLEECDVRYRALANQPNTTPVLPPAELCTGYCNAWRDACCGANPPPNCAFH